MKNSDAVADQYLDHLGMVTLMALGSTWSIHAMGRPAAGST